MIEIKKPLTITWVTVNDRQYPSMNIPKEVSDRSFLRPDEKDVMGTYQISEGKVIIILEKMEG